MPERFWMGLRLALLVFDVSNPESLHNIRAQYQDIITSKSSNLKMILIGNKTDLKDRTITEEQGRELAKELSIPYYEVSSKTGRCVESAFTTFTHNIISEAEKIQLFVPHTNSDFCSIL